MEMKTFNKNGAVASGDTATSEQANNATEGVMSPVVAPTASVPSSPIPDTVQDAASPSQATETVSAPQMAQTVVPSTDTPTPFIDNTNTSSAI